MLISQFRWRLADRDSWGNIVDADGQKVLYLIDRPVVQTYDEPERLWWHNGCVLLDGDNHPGAYFHNPLLHLFKPIGSPETFLEYPL